MPINKSTLVLAVVGAVVLTVMVAFILTIKNPRYTQTGIAVNTLENRQQPESTEEEQPTRSITEEATAEVTAESVETTDEASPPSSAPDEGETPEVQPTPTSRSRVPGSITLSDDMTSTPSE